METIKTYLLGQWRSAYLEKKDYFDRFFIIFLVLLACSIACQVYSGWSEYHYIQQHWIGDNIVHTGVISTIIVLLYEVIKTLVIGKFMYEFLGAHNQFNSFFLVLGISLQVNSVYMSLNGAEVRAELSIPYPVDTKTAQTDSIYTQLVAENQKRIAEIKDIYTYKGNFYMPQKGNKYHSSIKILNHRKELARLEESNRELRNEHADMRNSNQTEYTQQLTKYGTDLHQKRTRNKYNVVITESLYLIFMIYIFHFQVKSIKPTDQEYDGENQVPKNSNPNNDIGNPQNGKPDLSAYLNNLNMWNGQLTTIMQKVLEKLGSMSEPKAIVQSEPWVIHNNNVSEGDSNTELTEIEERTCEADGCSNKYKVNIRKEGPNKRKYCSEACQRKMKYKHRDLRRAEQKDMGA